MKVVLYVILFLYSAVDGQAPADKDYYNAAVVDYATYKNTSQSPGVNIRRNVDEYIRYIQQAKDQDADIVVFPECGLVGTGSWGIVSNLELYTTIIPNPKEQVVVPCNHQEWSDVLIRLSCAAKEKEIYVVVNLPERQLIERNKTDEKFINYNTNIVFDRKGALIAKYRKQNLYGEPGFERSDTDDITTFVTDFGVTFGTFTCFDILFAKPSLQTLRENRNVTDIVFPSAWFSELPFLTAVQAQAGWARAYGVNLLASGYNNPSSMSGGSGIYRANGDVVYIMPVSKKTTMLVSRVPKIQQRANPDTIGSSTAKVTIENKLSASLEYMQTKIDDNITDYTTVLINRTNVNQQQVCHGTFCCTFTIKFTPIEKADYYYRLVAYDGPRSFTVETNNIQICALIACANTSQGSCGERVIHTENPLVFQEISISGGPFRTVNDTVVIPTNTLYDLSILKSSDFTYKVTNSAIEMKTTQQVKQLLAFGIYSVTKNASSSSTVLVSLIVVCLIGLFFNKN